ncbi:family 78 glycoside hydrolase catalytic domain [Flavicella sediminum]|uniref:family 78 glycoside hydrolase catalytic domain n=1 Tax=Flavicella sediminum TaxID=2585141 RepID=UPI00140866BD|nr:family 78 glycoside hydrolase catalytic domain [Flavicella sediminum]
MNYLQQRVLFFNKARFAFFTILILGFSSCEIKKENIESTKNCPSGLTVEYIREPSKVFIVDEKPEFGWLVPSVAISQTAYQIIVASSEELLKKNKGDVWDSKKVLTNNSSNVSYSGKALEMGKTYFWKVKIWGQKGEETGFSARQSFQMGRAAHTITSANSFQTDSIKPLKLAKTGEGAYFVDLGKAAFANLQFEYKSKVRDTLIIHIGEELIGGKINRKPQGTIRYQQVKVPVSPDKYVYNLAIKPDKRNTKKGAVLLPNTFPVLMPFRYVEMEGLKTSINKSDFTQLAFHSYWEEEESHFKSSDTVLNQVWDLCKYSIKATTFAGVYVDGDRERIPYEADAYLNQLSHYTTDREYAMARQTIEYFMEHPTWPTEWQLHVALMFYADYMYTGNTELIERYYDDLKHKTLVELRREDGLVSSLNATPEFMKKLGFKSSKAKLKDIVDWPPAQKDTGWKLATAEGERDGFVFTPINTVINCLYYRNVEIMQVFAQLLNEPEDEQFYKELAIKVKKAINEKLLDVDRGFYTDGETTAHASLHSNMMALAFNIVPEAQVKSVADFIKSRGMACSVYGSQYLLEALYNANESTYALQLMTSTENRSWYNMIRIGSTMTLEAWDMKYKPNSDWNHAWGAVPANAIPRGLWGIQPKAAGFSIASIKPQMGTLKTSSVKVPTIKGAIKADFVLQNSKSEKYTIEIPANMTAEFEVVKAKKVLLNGQEVVLTSGIIQLNSGESILEVSY